MESSDIPRHPPVRHQGLVTHALWGGHRVQLRKLPERLRVSPLDFEALWCMRPATEQLFRLYGKWVPLPRRHQAFGMPYTFSGVVSSALPTPPELLPILQWARAAIDSRLNGILVNYYHDGSEYIGPHRDSIINMCSDAPIVTISLGATRVLRIRPWTGASELADFVGEYRDFTPNDGDVVVLDYSANLALTHEIVQTAKPCGRRISITIRAFAEGSKDQGKEGVL